MNERKRWSETGSDVDPVLRQVVRYGQGLKPSDAALQRLIIAVSQRGGRPERRRNVRRFAVAVGLSMAAALGGLAWASDGTDWFSPPSLERPRQVAQPQSASPPPAAVGLAPAPMPSVALAVSPPPSPPARVSSAPPSASASLLVESDLLQQARAAVAANPSRALTLTREHELRFPSSALVEERQALRIEALWRLGRRSEAQHALGAFEASFPLSPYRRRLRGLVPP